MLRGHGPGEREGDQPSCEEYLKIIERLLNANEPSFARNNPPAASVRRYERSPTPADLELELFRYSERISERSTSIPPSRSRAHLSLERGSNPADLDLELLRYSEHISGRNASVSSTRAISSLSPQQIGTGRTKRAGASTSRPVGEPEWKKRALQQKEKKTSVSALRCV